MTKEMGGSVKKAELTAQKACFLHFSSHLCLTFRKRSGQSVQPLPLGVLKAGGSLCPAFVLFHYRCREYLLDSYLSEEGLPGFVHLCNIICHFSWGAE